MEVYSTRLLTPAERNSMPYGEAIIIIRALCNKCESLIDKIKTLRIQKKAARDADNYPLVVELDRIINKYEREHLKVHGNLVLMINHHYRI